MTQKPSGNSMRMLLSRPRAVTLHGCPKRSGNRVRTRHLYAKRAVAKRSADDPVPGVPTLCSLICIDHAPDPGTDNQQETDQEDGSRPSHYVQHQDGDSGADVAIDHRPNAGNEEGDDQ